MMEKQYAALKDYEKTIDWKSRFGAIYRIYLGKLWSSMIKDGKSWIFNILMILPVVAGPINAILSRGELDYADYFTLYTDIMFLGYFGLIIPLFTMYVAAMMFNDEINDRTITYFTTRPIHRFELIIVKYLTYLTIVPLFTAISSGLVYISFGVFAGFRYWDMGLWYFMAAIIAAIVYGAVFMFIGLLFKNPLWFGLFFVFIWEFVFASFSQTLNSLTIAFYIKSLIVTDIFPNDLLKWSPAVLQGSEAQGFFLTGNPATPVTYSIVMLVIIIVSLTLSWSRLQGDRFVIPYGAGRRPGGWKYYLKEIRSYLITFSIIFLTVGLVVAPVTGLRKDTARASGDYIEVDPYPYWDADIPSLNDMGFGASFSYTLSKGDQITIGYSYDFAPFNQSYSLYGILVSEQNYQEFIQETQELWAEYQRQYFNYIYNDTEVPSTLFPVMLSEYFITANQFLGDCEDTVAMTSPQQTYYINYESTKAEDFYVMIFVTQFDYIFDRYFYTNADFVLTGTINRLGGYVFGWILAGFGAITTGFAIYSLVTYSSEDEIKRYELQTQNKRRIRKVRERSEESIDNSEK